MKTYNPPIPAIAPAPVQGRPFLLSVVAPVYNEQEVLPEFHRRLSDVLKGMQVNAEILYVNDGSTDNTLTILLQLHKSDPSVAVLDLSRNFGKEIAITAGLDHAAGDTVAVIDSDLQDPPELIPEMLREWQKGYDVVYMKRASRHGESWLKKLTARLFYRVIGEISRVEIPENVGDFRLLSRRAVDALKRFPERSRFMKGLFAWIGYPQKELLYHRDARYAGQTKWNYWALWNFALEGITSFSITPLKVASYVGLLTALGAFAYGAFVIIKTVLMGEVVRGYPTLIVVILFLGGIQLMAIGIIGEYLGRLFMEVKQRPLYLLQRHLPAVQSASREADKSGTDNE